VIAARAAEWALSGRAEISPRATDVSFRPAL
jgi:hypothetical protein